jgi:hypothetical protein
VPRDPSTQFASSVINISGKAGAKKLATVAPNQSSDLYASQQQRVPWLPLGTFSYVFVAKRLGYFEKRGLDVTIDRGFGSTKVCVPVDQIRLRPASIGARRGCPF